MPGKSSNPLKVFIGCPGDMAPERDALLSLEKKLARRGCAVEFLIWPDVPPAAGRPQQVIFDHFPVETWDIFVGLLWNRFGSPAGEKDDRTGKPMTGTEEEFKRAYAAWKASDGRRPHIAVYRCERPEVTKGKGAQIAAVDAFFDQLAAEKDFPALSFSFTDPHKFKDDVEEHLVEIIGKIRDAEKADASAKRTAKTATKKAVDWAVAEGSYRQHLLNSHRMITCHTAESGRQRVEVELERVFIKLMATSGRRDSYSIFSNGELLSGSAVDLWDQLTWQGENEIAFHELQSGTVVERRYNFEGFRRALREQPEHSPIRALAPSPTTLPDLLCQQNHLALSGSPGSGKSTLLQYLVLTFASRQQQARLQLDGERLPVFIRLRQFHRWVEGRLHEKKLGELKTAHFHEFLAHQWAEEKGAPELPGGFFQRLLHDKRALILLDGLDEVAEPAQRRTIASLVATALGDWREARVILTSRPKAWESEGRAAFGSRVGEARICDLDDAQIEEFVRHWYLAATIAARGDTPSARGHAESRAVDLIAAVKPERIRKLAATPLMLSILAMVHSRGVGLPQERSQLYHECIEFMLGYWDEIAGFSPDPELHEVASRERQVKRQLLEPVALWMHRLGSEQIEPLHDDLVKQFAAGFESVLNEPKACAERHARAFLRLIVERGGLMQESEAGQFRFVHLTFQEYLAASAIAHGEAPFAQVEKHLHDPWWREVILLAGGELSRQRSFRVKADTAAWLTGILQADNWAEQWLLRDLQLAAQSCADMSETGVDPSVTADLATRLIVAVMDLYESKAVTDLSETIRQLPAWHLTRAIAAQLPGTLPRGKKWNHIPALVISPLLPAAVIDSPLLAAFAVARESENAEIARRGAFLHLLHGPAVERLPSLAILHRIENKTLMLIGEEEAEKLFALGDEALTKAIRAEWRKNIGVGKSFTAPFWLPRILRHGTAEDQTATLAALVAGLRSNIKFIREFTVSQLHEIGPIADTPEVITALEEIITQPEHDRIGEALQAWCTIVSQRGTTADLALLCGLIAHPESKGWDAAAAFLLQHGDAEARAATRTSVQERMAAGYPATQLGMVSILLTNDPEPDRPALAERVEQIMAGKEEFNSMLVFGLARKLGETAWTCPHLIARIGALSTGDDYEAAAAIATLAELSPMRPSNALAPCPSVAKLAQCATALATKPTTIGSRLQILSALRALSTFPELRTAGTGKDRRCQGGQSRKRTKTVGSKAKRVKKG